jgi:hypothetical protein
MDLFNRIRDVLAAEANDAQLDKFLADVRDSLTASNRQFLSYQALIIGSLVTYHLVKYGGSTGISVGGLQLTDTLLFQRVFLIFPAALLAASACVGYLRRLQREVFDFLSISRYRILAKTAALCQVSLARASTERSARAGHRGDDQSASAVRLQMRAPAWHPQVRRVCLVLPGWNMLWRATPYMWARLSPAGSPRLRLAHLLDHLVGCGKKRGRY